MPAAAPFCLAPPNGESISLRVSILASGSSGNCTLLETSQTRLLVDAGLGKRETLRRLAALANSVDRLDGIVFPGGADVAPEEYGEVPIDNLNVIEAPRDRTELTLARWAFADDLPTLGICRGQQLLNVALGGSLYQDLRHQGVTSVEHSDADGRARNALLHRVRLDPSSQLAQLIDETSIEVNSLHHQAVKTIAPQLRATGTSEDGVIESLESDGRRFLIAVQWHPEEIDELPWVRRLFQSFAKAAQTRS